MQTQIRFSSAPRIKHGTSITYLNMAAFVGVAIYGFVIYYTKVDVYKYLLDTTYCSMRSISAIMFASCCVKLLHGLFCWIHILITVIGIMHIFC